MATDDTRVALASASASYPTPDWVRAMEKDPEFCEVENRPWANRANRAASGCVGNDFVLHHPRILFRFFWHQIRQALEGAVIWTKDTEGPPKGAHGASVTTVFDEILAYPVWRSGVTAFTANLNVNFRRMIPFASCVRFISYVDRVEGRKIYVRGRLFDPTDHKIVYADAVGIWVQSDYLTSIGINNADSHVPNKTTGTSIGTGTGTHTPRRNATYSSSANVSTSTPSPSSSSSSPSSSSSSSSSLSLSLSSLLPSPSPSPSRSSLKSSL